MHTSMYQAPTGIDAIDHAALTPAQRRVLASFQSRANQARLEALDCLSFAHALCGHDDEQASILRLAAEQHRADAARAEQDALTLLGVT
jgi:hypothetical protein